MLPILVAVLVSLPAALSQSFTFPLSPNQPYPQYNNVFESRYPYIPGQQMSPIGQMNGLGGQGYQINQMSQTGQMNGINQAPMHNSMAQRFQFNPMTRIQVQPPMQGQSFEPARVTSPVGPSEYQVDQRAPSQQPFSAPTRIVPPFLKSASVGEQDRFYEIVQHPTWSGVEKNRRIEEFMRTMSDARQEMYSEFRHDVIDKETEEKRRNVDRAVSSMSKEAVEQFQKVVAIMHDPMQPEPERLKKIEEIYSKLPDSIRKEFDAKLKGF
ncbi:unnamed protein product [Caenorhabditis sp. 36 PRJEB53466]|nr:unnamed protein product [Caenorhabditis sp. 36 PRJEB53466]